MQIPYTALDRRPTTLMPRLPLNLIHGRNIVEVIGLVASGSPINLMPYSIGRALELDWAQHTTRVPLGGDWARFEARAVIVGASHMQITHARSVRLVFAWINTDSIPILLGQMNFFMEFEVTFYRSQGMFDVRLRP
jgi:hypothetical protein